MPTNTAAARIHRTTDVVVAVVVLATVASALFAPHMWLSHDIAAHIVHVLDVVDDEARHMLHAIRHRVARRRTA